MPEACLSPSRKVRACSSDTSSCTVLATQPKRGSTLLTWMDRRTLLGGALKGALGLAAATQMPAQRPAASSAAAGFFDLLRQPDLARAFLGLTEPVRLQREGQRWSGSGIQVLATAAAQQLQVHVEAPGKRLTHVQLRWQLPVRQDMLLLGDAWERSYGDLHWASLVPERVMPWYFLAKDGDSLNGYGVKTGAGALCFWQVDADGVSLWLNVSNGGNGVDLGPRRLLAATIVTRHGAAGEGMMAAARAFCGQMCSAPRPRQVIYGSNDWYYAYGKNSAAQTLRDAELIASVSPRGGVRPFTVIDDGWRNSSLFPDMPGLAEDIRRREVRPGIWVRPLQAGKDETRSLLLPDQRFGAPTQRAVAAAFDPTIPEALDKALQKVREAVAWKYDLVKHDFSAWEMFGRWGFQMGAQPTAPGWSFHDSSRTNAEIVRDLYQQIRLAAGAGTVLIGCNTIGHLAAGIFDAQRTGDDVSGREWERTRRMGVNTLAFRLPQQATFFALDADCVPITNETPWTFNRQWLDLLARSGTALLVSPEPQAVHAEQREALRQAFAIAATGTAGAEPVNWIESTTPEKWAFTNSSGPRSQQYDWSADAGAWPFTV